MVAVMDNDESVFRQQGQREADTGSRCNNQIKTTAVARQRVAMVGVYV